ncbi:unnamed protein product, partial [Closterium sp. Naga37s-1]
MSPIAYDDPEKPPLHQSHSSAHVRARDAAEPSAEIGGPRGEELQVARPVEGPAAPGHGAECPQAGKVGGCGGGRGGRAELLAAENGEAPAVRGASGGRGTRSGRGTGGGRKRRRRIAVARTALGCACALLVLLGVALMWRTGGDGGISGSWRAGAVNIQSTLCSSCVSAQYPVPPFPSSLSNPNFPFLSPPLTAEPLLVHFPLEPSPLLIHLTPLALPPALPSPHSQPTLFWFTPPWSPHLCCEAWGALHPKLICLRWSECEEKMPM